MKKIISLVLCVVLLCGCVFTLASCGNKPSGTYVYEVAGVELGKLEFKGDKITMSMNYDGESEVMSGTYEIVEKDGGSLEIVITMEVDGKEETAPGVAYEKGDDYIKIAGIKYVKK